MTKNTLLSSFIELFPNPKQITLKDWIKVLAGISAHFDSDEAFHGYIEGIWSF